MNGLKKIRAHAESRFAELGFPTTHEEEWRFTSVAPIAKTEFAEAPPAADGWQESLSEFEGIRMVFVNGRYSPHLSSRKLPAGIVAQPLREANGAASRHLARYAGFEQQAFVAWNTARFTDGAYIETPASAVLSEPIHLIFITATDQPVVSHPRSLVVIGSGSQATVMETYLGHGAQYLTNAVTEIVAGDRSVADHWKLQCEDDSAFHVATIQAHAGRDASLSTNSVSLGGRLVRNDVNTVLSEGSEAVLNGLYAVDGEQHVDHHTEVDHAKPHGTSRELYKGILDGRASAVFNGRIRVRQDAQKTNSKQTNNNLVLSEDSIINTKPELQIFADDVRCTHGATIGQLDADAIFYLQSRGIGWQKARALLIRAFAQEILEGLRTDAVRAPLERRVWEKLHDHHR